MTKRIDTLTNATPADRSAALIDIQRAQLEFYNLAEASGDHPTDLSHEREWQNILTAIERHNAILASELHPCTPRPPKRRIMDRPPKRKPAKWTTAEAAA